MRVLCVVNNKNDNNNKVDVLHVRLTELHAAHQNLPPAIRILLVKETIQNIHRKQTKSDNCGFVHIMCI